MPSAIRRPARSRSSPRRRARSRSRRCWCTAGSTGCGRPSASARPPPRPRRRRRRRRVAFRDLGARLGPETTAMRSGAAPVTSAMTWLIRMQVPARSPFINETQHGLRGDQRRPAGQAPAQALRRDGEHQEIRAGQGLGRVGRGAHRGREGDAGQVFRVLMVAVDLPDHLGAPPAQHGLVPESARTRAKAEPQLPVPKTAARVTPAPPARRGRRTARTRAGSVRAPTGRAGPTRRGRRDRSARRGAARRESRPACR